jgi:hypothetical protein
MMCGANWDACLYSDVEWVVFYETFVVPPNHMSMSQRWWPPWLRCDHFQVHCHPIAGYIVSDAYVPRARRGAAQVTERTVTW